MSQQPEELQAVLNSNSNGQQTTSHGAGNNQSSEDSIKNFESVLPRPELSKEAKVHHLGRRVCRRYVVA